MQKKICYKGLNRPVYILKVPLLLLVIEICVGIFAIFIVKLNIIIVLLLLVGFHVIIAKQYKKDSNWINHLIFRMRIPERRIYKKNLSYFPKYSHEED